jgi:dTDP-4-dehydrorhamnose reductase
MNLNKLLIIGKNSFIGSNIFFLLKKNLYIKSVNYSDFIKMSKKTLSNFNYIVNCCVDKNYVLKKYNKKYDLDYHILNKILSLNINYIFLSSRKVYMPKFNIREDDQVAPRDNYEKNKIITENYIKKVSPNNHLILRISNVIGRRLIENNKSHNLFLDNFLISLKDDFLIKNNGFKDFISIDQFSSIFLMMIRKNLKGVFNVSLGKKIYISEILKWLTSASKKSFKMKNFYKNKIYNKDSFTLNNNKLKKCLNISINKGDLRAYCLKISRKIFGN